MIYRLVKQIETAHFPVDGLKKHFIKNTQLNHNNWDIAVLFKTSATAE